MNTDIIELDKQISSIFKTSENQQKYEKLVLDREQILKNQSSNEVQNLECEIDEIKIRQSNSGERRNELLKIIQEKAEVVREIQPKIEAAKRELDKANLDLSFFEQNVSHDRIKLNELTAKLNKLTGVKDELEKLIS